MFLSLFWGRGRDVVWAHSFWIKVADLVGQCCVQGWICGWNGKTWVGVWSGLEIVLVPGLENQGLVLRLVLWPAHSG